MKYKKTELDFSKSLVLLVTVLTLSGCEHKPEAKNISQLVPSNQYKIISNEVWYKGKKLGVLAPDIAPAKLKLLPGDIQDYVVTNLENGDMFLSGGTVAGKDNVASKMTFFWDNKTKKLIPGPDMSCPRVEHTVTKLSGNRLLITGGRSYEPEHTFAVAVDIVDVPTRSIKYGGKLKVDRIEHGVLELAPERIIIVGGSSFSSKTTNGMDTDSVEIYNPETGQTIERKMLRSRHYPELFKIDTLNVLVVGGYSADSEKGSKPLPVEKLQIDSPS